MAEITGYNFLDNPCVGVVESDDQAWTALGDRYDALGCGRLFNTRIIDKSYSPDFNRMTPFVIREK